MITLVPDADCRINQWTPASNYGTGSLSIDVLYLGGAKDQNMRALMRWLIPPEINSNEFDLALLCLYGRSPVNPGVAAHVYRIDSGGSATYWIEDEATWNNRKAATAWTTAGGDYTNPNVAFNTLAAIGWLTLDITALVKDAIDNRNRVLDLLLRLDDEAPGVDTQMIWGSRDNSALGQFPYVLLVRPPFGLPMGV